MSLKITWNNLRRGRVLLSDYLQMLGVALFIFSALFAAHKLWHLAFLSSYALKIAAGALVALWTILTALIVEPPINNGKEMS